MNNNKTPKQVEEALNALFKKYNVQNKVSVSDIKKWIWNATGGVMEASNKFQKRCLNIFPLEGFYKMVPGLARALN